MRYDTDTAILGGGASGLACAIRLKTRSPKMQVTIFEKLSIVGKKILATGNGRCNLSNFIIDESFYSGDKDIVHTVIKDFSAVDCLRFFGGLGLKIRNEENRLYPYSMHSESVRGILEREALRLGVKIVNNYKVESVAKEKYGFKINNDISCKYCVLALGGKAAPMHGTDGDGYKLLKGLGIRYEHISPALVQIKVQEAFVKSLAGIRVSGMLFLRPEDDSDDKPIKYQEGEILFTDYGLSGIPAMQISGDVARMTLDGEKPKLSICLTPNLGLSDVNEYLSNQVERYGNVCPEILYGLVHEKLAKVIYDLSDGDINRIALNTIAMPLTAVGTNSYRNAQVTRGGVGAEQLCKDSLESKAVSGVYICGELLNADGLCGGYNLHFAWGSGIKVADEITYKEQNDAANK